MNSVAKNRVMDLLPEIWSIIFGHVGEGSTYKNILFTCKGFQQLMERDYPEKKDRLCNHLATLLKLFPNKPWDWYGLSANPNVTWAIVEANLDKPWDWDWLSANPNVTWAIVKANPDKPWNWDELSGNKFNKPK